MFLRHQNIAKFITICALAVTGLAGKGAQAAPPYNNLQPGKDAAGFTYGTVTPTLVSSGGGKCTYRFTVTASHPRNGIKGLLVYGPKPLSMSDLPRTTEHLYTAERHSWWDINGGPDTNNNGLADPFLEPGETRNDFFLTYADPCPKATDLRFAVHVVLPGGNTFFAGAGNTPPPPSTCAKITGKVVCAGTKRPVEGATVRLVQGSSTVRSTTSGAGGAFSFETNNPALADGNYTIAVEAGVDFLPASLAFSYACKGSDIQAEITVTPQPVDYLKSEILCGAVYFSDVQTFRDREVPGVTIGYNDLFTLAGDLSKSYRYSGAVPNFPGLSFSGDVWVIIGQTLAPEGKWNNCSFTNLVGVEGGIKTGAGRARSPYTYRMVFNQPFVGPGTAYNYTITSLDLTNGSLTPPTWSILPLVRPDGSATMPFNGQVPAGWMAQTRYEFKQMPGVANTAWAVGSFTCICDCRTDFRIHPDLDGGP